MTKDPAFLFYSQDFLVGTMALPLEERGRYITILCYMHQNGHISEETIRLLVGSFSDILRSKFKQDADGLFYNERMDIEVEKRAKFTESRKNNGIKGGRPSKGQSLTEKKPKKTDRLAKNNLIENENVSVIEVELKLSSVEENGLVEIFEKWVKYKADRKEKYKTTDSLKIAYEKLKRFSGGDPVIAEKIITDAIGNNYAGFFEPKQIGQPPGQPQQSKAEAAINSHLNFMQKRHGEQFTGNK